MRVRFWPALLALALVSAALRVRFAALPLTSDEGGFLAIARAWAGGAALYDEVWVDRPQGLLVLYRLGDWLLGPDLEAMRWFAIGWGAALVVVVGLLARLIAGGGAGLAAAAITAVATAAPTLEGHTANGELLSALPAAGAILCLAAWMRGHGRTAMPIAAGLFAASSLLVKQSGYDAGLACAAWLALAAWRGWRPRAEALRALVLLAAGASLPLALAVAHGAATGIGDWWYAVAGYRLEARSAARGADWGRLADTARIAAPVLVPALVLALAGLRTALRGRESALLALWAGAAATSFLLGGQFHRHYWVLLATPLAALAGLGAERLARSRGATFAMAAVAVAVVLPLLAAAPALVATDRSTASLRTSDDRRLLADGPIGRLVRARGARDDRVYALYASAALYVNADRAPPLPYLWFDGVEQVPGALERLRALLAGPAAPRFVAIYQQPGQIDREGRVGALLRARYRPLRTIEGVRVLELHKE